MISTTEYHNVFAFNLLKNIPQICDTFLAFLDFLVRFCGLVETFAGWA